MDKDNLINKVCAAWGWTHKELAQKMNYSIGTIKNASSIPEKVTGPMESHLHTLLEYAEYKKSNK